MTDSKLDSKRYWTENNQWFDDLYTKTTWFDRQFRRDVYGRWALAQEVCARLKHPRVLDVGCGSGHVALSLVEKCGAEHVTGVDFSESMLDLAGKTFRARGRERQLTLVKGDVMNGALPANRFDLVLGLGLFDYVKDARALFSRMLELSSGVVVASFPAPAFPRSALRKFRYGLRGCPVYFYTHDAVVAVTQSAEFKIRIHRGQSGFLVEAGRS